MEVKGIIWLGVRTSNFDAMVNWYRGAWGWKSPIRKQASS